MELIASIEFGKQFNFVMVQIMVQIKKDLQI